MSDGMPGMARVAKTAQPPQRSIHASNFCVWLILPISFSTAPLPSMRAMPKATIAPSMRPAMFTAAPCLSSSSTLYRPVVVMAACMRAVRPR